MDHTPQVFTPQSSDGDGKLSIGVASLPCIACQADFATNGRALTSESDMTSVDRKNKKEIYEP